MKTPTCFVRVSIAVTKASTTALSIVFMVSACLMLVSCASKEDQAANAKFNTLVQARYNKLHSGSDDAKSDSKVWDKAKDQIKQENPELWTRVDANAFVNREAYRAVLYDMANDQARSQRPNVDTAGVQPPHVDTPVVDANCAKGM